MKKEKVSYEYDAENGVAFCYIEEFGQTFVGAACCHDDDRDMMSERTGCEIANRRAYIDLLKYEKDCIIAPALKALKQLYYSLNTNKNFNRKSLEAKRIYRHIRMYENELAVIKAELASEKQGLKDYIAGKEKFYQRHRSLAAKAENE
jgi:hypothetical protein